MSIMNAYIVFILQVGQDLVSGFTTDIDSIMDDHKDKGSVSLVFQQHFDDPDKGQAFASQLEKWDREKKEALISGKINYS